MTLQVLSWLNSVGPEEADLLVRLCRDDPDGNDATFYILEHAANRLQIWRCADGLVLTQLLTNAKGKELFVRGIVGRGILRVLAELADDLKIIGKSFGCSYIGGNNMRPALAKLYDKLGALPVYTYYELEID